MNDFLKRCLTALALVSMFNMAVVIAAIAVAWSGGFLEHDRVHAAWAALRGEAPAAEATSRPAEKPEKAAKPPKKDESPDEARVEIVRTELERRRREIQDGWRELERQQIALVARREQFEREKKEYKAMAAARDKQAAEDGFKKELEIVSGLKAKDAKELLRLKSDADVVRFMAAFEPRTARKIVGECKKSEERQWIGRILEKLNQQGVAQAEVLNAAQ